MQQIQTPVLRLFVTFYRFIGAQVFQIDWSNWKSILHLSWNVAFVLLIFYGIYTQDPLRIETMVSPCASQKPLFTYFVHVATKYTYPLVYLFQAIYNFVYGNKIVQLLDSPCFRQFYKSKRNGQLAFLGFLFANHAFFAAVMLERVKVHMLASWPSPCDYLAYLCLYIVFQFVYWLYIAIHYCQNATYGLLGQIEAKLKESEDEDEALRQLKDLALINRQISTVLSPPLLTYLFLTVFNVIMVVCLALICQPNARMAIHIIISCSYANYITWLNHRVRQKVNNIFDTLRQHYEKLDSLPPKSALTTNPNQSLLCWIIQIDHRESVQSRRIRVQELVIYGQYFRLEVFQLGAIDLRFLFQTCLFILGYIVFFTQTH